MSTSNALHKFLQPQKPHEQQKQHTSKKFKIIKIYIQNIYEMMVEDSTFNVVGIY